MAADLHIHIKTEGITEKDLANFKSNTLGSKYFNPRTIAQDTLETEASDKKVSSTPHVWIGEVSWLKAGLFEDNEAFIPSAVQKISNYIGEDLPTLTKELIDKIVGALSSKNKTGYSIADPENVRRFLEKYKGKPIYTISW